MGGRSAVQHQLYASVTELLIVPSQKHWKHPLPGNRDLNKSLKQRTLLASQFGFRNG